MPVRCVMKRLIRWPLQRTVAPVGELWERLLAEDDEAMDDLYEVDVDSGKFA